MACLISTYKHTNKIKCVRACVYMIIIINYYLVESSL